MSEDLYSKFEYHIKESDESRRDLRDMIENLRDNHFHSLAEDVNILKVITEGIKADLKWIKIISSFLILQSISILIKLFL